MAGPNIYDQLISGSFDALGLPGTVGSPFLTPEERAKLEKQIADSRAMQSALPPPVFASTAPRLPKPPPLPTPNHSVAMAFAPPPPVPPALAALASAVTQPTTQITAKMQPAKSGGLLDLLLGPSKNGMGGIAGLLGGPQAGGLLGMLSQPRAPSGSRITGQGGGGAFIAERGTPAFEVGEAGALLPASMNTERWRTGY